MMQEDQSTYRHAVGAALMGLGVQALSAMVLLILALWADNAAFTAATWHAFGGLGLWLCLVILYQQHKLEAIERLEAEQLAERHGTDSSIFETRADDLAMQRRRLRWIYKWLLPLGSLATAAYLIGVGTWLAVANLGAEPLVSAQSVNPFASHLALMAALVSIAFLAFVISRYFAGMAKVSAWQLLRGGAGYVVGVALVTFLLLIAMLAVEAFEAGWLLAACSVAVPIFMAIIGVEIVLNFVLDLYRPKRKGEVPRAAFDSRLLSLLTQPESIAKTINEAINYQFGFEITRSWFWQLLSKAFGWLVIFGAVVLIGFSAIVVVEPHQMAIVTRFGAPADEPIGPGLHLKAPWPIGQVEFFDVTAVRVITLGQGAEAEPSPDAPAEADKTAILWTNVHSQSEEKLVVAAPRDVRQASETGDGDAPTGDDGAPGEGGDDRPPLVALVNAEIAVYYRIRPNELWHYINAGADAHAVEQKYRQAITAQTRRIQVGERPGPPNHHMSRLQNLVTEQVTAYLLRHDIDEWIGSARVTAPPKLKAIIQQACDEAAMGVDVLAVAFAGVHPPNEVAEKFHEVVTAQQERETAIQQAEQEAQTRLTEVAGSEDQALGLLRAIDALSAAKAADGGDAAAQRQQRVDALLADLGGAAAVKIAEARAVRWEKENTELGKVQRFEQQREAYRRAPRLFRARMLLEAMLAGLGEDARKFIVIGEYRDLDLRGDFTTIEGFDLPGEDAGN